MPKRLVGVFQGEVIPFRAIQLRQGLVPHYDMGYKFGVPSTNGTSNLLEMSPDQSYVVGANNNSSNNMWVYRNKEDLSQYSQPSVNFASTIYTCAISDTHYAFGGGTPYLLVFNKKGELQTISTAGLGTVYKIDFSPDGKYFGVVHSTAPYVRIYKLADLTFVNGAAGSNTPYLGCFSHDSTKFYTFSYSGSPVVSKYDTATGTRSNVSTNAAHAGTSYLNGNRVARYPDGKTIIYCANVIATGLLYLDTTTDSITAGPVFDQAIGACINITLTPRAVDDYFYINHQPGSSGRTISKFRLSSKRMVIDEGENTVYRNLLYGNASAASSVILIDFDAHKISGTVRDISNLPVKRMVRAFQRATGVLAAQTESDAVTGNYELRVDNAGPFDVQFYTVDGELLNDLFYSKVEAEPVS